MKDFTNIYNYFSEYSEEEVNEMLSELTDMERINVSLKFDKTGQNKMKEDIWGLEQIAIFHSVILPKMKKILAENRAKTLEFLKTTKVTTTKGSDLPEEKAKLEKIEETKTNEETKTKKRLNKRAKTIYDYFEGYSKEQINDAIAKLNDKGKELLKLRYGEDLENPRATKMSHSQYNYFYTVVVIKIKYLLAHPEEDFSQTGHKRNTKTIYDYFSGYTEEQIKNAVARLPIDYREIIKIKYGDNLDQSNNMKILSAAKDSQLYTKVIPQLKYLLEHPEEDLSQFYFLSRCKSLYTFFPGYSKKEIDAALSKLNEKDKEVIQLKFGQYLDYPQKSKDCTANIDTAFYIRVKNRIMFFLQNPEKKEIKEAHSIKTIYDYFLGYSKEQILDAVSKLPLKYKEILWVNFGKDLEHPQKKKDLPVKNYLLFYRTIKKSIEYLLEHPEEKIKEEEFIKKIEGRKKKTIYAYFDHYSEEQIDDAIRRLPKRYRDIIQIKFNYNLADSDNLEQLTGTQTNYFYRKVVPTMYFLLRNPKEDLSKERVRSKTTTLYSYFNNYSKEEVDYVVANLSEEYKDLLKSMFDENLALVVRGPKEITQNVLNLLKNKIHTMLIILRRKEEAQNKEENIKEYLIYNNLGELLMALTPVEALIISLKYGFRDNIFYTTEEIARILQISEEEIINIAKKAFIKYQQYLLTITKQPKLSLTNDNK